MIRNYTLFTGAGEEHYKLSALAGVHNVFLGRNNELQEITRLLRQKGSSPIAIIGAPHSGKSWLVSRFLTTQPNSPWHWIDFSNLERDVDWLAVGKLYDQVQFARIRSTEFILVLENVEAIGDNVLNEFLILVSKIKDLRNIILTSSNPLTRPGIFEINLEPWGRSLTGETNLSYEIEEPFEGQSIIKVVRPKIILLNNHVITRLKKVPKDIYKLHPRKFEEIIAELLADQGCDVEITTETRDGGKDIIASMNTPLGKVLTLVEVKRYAENRNIPVGLVRQLWGVLHDHEATNAMFVTTSSFTKDAKEFEKRHEFKLSLKEISHIQSWISRYGTKTDRLS